MDKESKAIGSLFDQFLKIQANAIEGIKFSDIEILSRASLYNISLELVNDILEVDDNNRCAISECSNKAVADVLHDNNSGAVPLCAKHLISYTKNLKNYLLTQLD